MADLSHWYGADIAQSPSGDLAPVDGLVRGEQRVLRRLLTNPGDYVWHPSYGAGLPRYIGATVDADAIEALIRAQLLAEDSVARIPDPQISVTPITDGIFVSIAYTDASSGQLARLSFNVT
jgi:phage baseplate assembly protein W